MDYGPHGGGHGHPDKLNLILFADGDELAGEPQFYRYEDSRHAEWTRPTIAHWTVSVDLHEQAPTTGKLLAYYDAGAVKVMRGVASGAYAGVALDRTVVQMPGYVADVYRGWSNARHTYDYPLCFRGALEALKGVDPARLKPLGQPTSRGYKHLAVLEPIKTDQNWTGAWSREEAAPDPAAEGGEAQVGHPANVIDVTLVGAPNTAIYLGRNVDQRDQVVVRREGKEATFAAVIDPYQDLQVVQTVERLEVAGPVPAYGLRVHRAPLNPPKVGGKGGTDLNPPKVGGKGGTDLNPPKVGGKGGTDLIIVRYDPQEGSQVADVSTFDGGQTNALVSVLRLDANGQIIEWGLVGGTRLSWGDQSLTLDKAGIRWSRGGRKPLGEESASLKNLPGPCRKERNMI
jgi:hypothetical protein